jgi:putative hydrolase of the HAD superfamily
MNYINVSKYFFLQIIKKVIRVLDYKIGLLTNILQIMKIDVITVDFWNTIFDSSGGAERNKIRLRALIEETDKLGYMILQEELDKSMKASWNHFNTIWLTEQRTPTAVELIEFLFSYLKIDGNDESIEKIAGVFANSILELQPKVIVGVSEVLKQFSNKYKLAIVSDTGFSPGTVLRELLRRENLIDYFSAFSFSNETKVAKPHPNAFLTVLDQFDCKPENALHIGDIEMTDIIGAKNLGMKAIRFSGDPTAFLVKDKPVETLADFETDKWIEIPELIQKVV